MKLCPNCRTYEVTGRASHYCPTCVKQLKKFMFRGRTQDYITAEVPNSVYRERKEGWK